MFSPDALRQIIRVMLRPLTASRHPLWSEDAEEILLMIAAHESALGRHLRQLGLGPARGLYQVEPKTMFDNYSNFLGHHPDLSAQVARVTGCPGPDLLQLQFNPLFGTIHARLKLYRAPGQLPPASDAWAMAVYAKAHYNTADGKATPEEYLSDYTRLVRSSQKSGEITFRSFPG